MLIITLIFLLIIFLGGMYFYAKYSNTSILEGIQTKEKHRCPNLLIQFDSKYYLYNSKIDKVPGVNPVVFNNLEEYFDFLNWQKSVGIKCPVLYVQNTYDAQGKPVLKIRPNVCEPQGGLPPTTTPQVVISIPNTSMIQDISVSNKDKEEKDKEEKEKKEKEEKEKKPLFSAIHPMYSQEPDKNDIRLRSTSEKEKKIMPNLRKVNYPQSLAPITPGKFTELSDDAMDVNWGGQSYTNASIEAGKYADNEVLFY
jgi:hypothetical protein